jgi:hypothetical protein
MKKITPIGIILALAFFASLDTSLVIAAPAMGALTFASQPSR